MVVSGLGEYTPFTLKALTRLNHVDTYLASHIHNLKTCELVSIVHGIDIVSRNVVAMRTTTAKEGAFTTWEGLNLRSWHDELPSWYLLLSTQ
jgi:hypothetical protein